MTANTMAKRKRTKKYLQNITERKPNIEQHKSPSGKLAAFLFPWLGKSVVLLLLQIRLSVTKEEKRTGLCRQTELKRGI
jgi:hypothetical protein